MAMHAGSISESLTEQCTAMMSPEAQETFELGPLEAGGKG